MAMRSVSIEPAELASRLVAGDQLAYDEGDVAGLVGEVAGIGPPGRVLARERELGGCDDVAGAYPVVVDGHVVRGGTTDTGREHDQGQRTPLALRVRDDGDEGPCALLRRAALGGGGAGPVDEGEGGAGHARAARRLACGRHRGEQTEGQQHCHGPRPAAPESAVSSASRYVGQVFTLFRTLGPGQPSRGAGGVHRRRRRRTGRAEEYEPDLGRTGDDGAAGVDRPRPPHPRRVAARHAPPAPREHRRRLRRDHTFTDRELPLAHREPGSQRRSPSSMSRGPTAHDYWVRRYGELVANGWRCADEGLLDLLSIEIVDRERRMSSSLRIVDSMDIRAMVDAIGPQVGAGRAREPKTQDVEPASPSAQMASGDSPMRTAHRQTGLRRCGRACAHRCLALMVGYRRCSVRPKTSPTTGGGVGRGVVLRGDHRPGAAGSSGAVGSAGGRDRRTRTRGSRRARWSAGCRRRATPAVHRGSPTGSSCAISAARSSAPRPAASR